MCIHCYYISPQRDGRTRTYCRADTHCRGISPRAGASRRASDKQEGVCLGEPLVCSYGIYDLVAVISGYLCSQFIDFTHPMSASLATADKDAVLVIGFYAGQATQVGDISVNGEGATNYINTALPTRPSVQSGKFISNSTAALSKTYND